LWQDNDEKREKKRERGERIGNWERFIFMKTYVYPKGSLRKKNKRGTGGHE